MAGEQRPKPLLIVVGTSLRAEEADRPLAYYLSQQIETSPAATAEGPFRAFVVADLRWLHDESLQSLPTISLGGPGVNLLTQRWFEEKLPFALVVDNEYFIQMQPDLEEPRISVWGMDNGSTQVAVSAFLRRYLPRFLERSAEAVESYDQDADDD